MTTQYKILAGILALAMLAAMEYLIVSTLLKAGKAQETSVYEKRALAAEQKADAITQQWEAKFNDAANAHAVELEKIREESQAAIAAASVNAATLNPTSIMRPSTIAASGVSASSTAPNGRRRTLRERLFCPAVLPESPRIPLHTGTEEHASDLTRQLNLAIQADTLNADYRELYNAWPQNSNSNSITSPSRPPR